MPVSVFSGAQVQYVCRTGYIYGSMELNSAIDSSHNDTYKAELSLSVPLSQLYLKEIFE